MFTLQNILAPPVLEGLLGEQYTLMDFLSRENSRVNSFFHICWMTWAAAVPFSRLFRLLLSVL